MQRRTVKSEVVIPGIEAITRRDFLFGGAATLLLGGCGSGGGDESSGGTRTFEHAMGTTEIPVRPERIITVTDQNALLPLLELGVKPVASAGFLEPDGDGVFRRTDGFDTSGVEFVGDFLEPNLEKIASLEPDLIVGYELQEDLYERLSGIAPTVFVQVFDRPLGEALMDFADLVNRTDRAERLRSGYNKRVATLLEGLGGRRETLSVSVISPGDAAGQFYRADVGQALGTVMSDLDLPRPEPQRSEGDFDPFSLETLPEHDADVVLVVDYSEEGEAPTLTELLKSPLYRSLAAYRADQTHVLDGTETVGAAWTRMEAFLAELERIILDSNLNPDTVKE